MEDNSFYDEFDISEVQSVQNHFAEIINTATVRFEFVSAVLSDFNDFIPNERNKKTKEFINQNWNNYKVLFSLEDLSENTQEILIKSILARIIYQSNTINKMKVNGLI